MLIRRCSQGNNIAIHLNNKPNMKKMIQLSNNDMVELIYPSDAKDYFVVVDGKIVKRSNSYVTCEEFYVDTCESQCGDSHGRIDLIKHKLINNVVTLR